MSSGSQETRAEKLAALARELRQSQELGASFFRAAAARSGMTVTDVQVMEILESAGPLTAGQLAEHTGLTTGAITGMLNRLEEAGIVRRERDPNDGRRVIVQLVSGREDKHEVGSIFDSIGKAWEELASHYDEEQLAFLLEFLERSNTLSRHELARLQAAQTGQGETYTAPLEGLTSARLVVPAGVFKLTLRANSELTELYQARFEGAVPDVKTKDGVVTIRYPRRLWMLGIGQGEAEINLNTSIPWYIAIQGGASEITTDLGRLNLAGMEVKGGMSTIHLKLPVPLKVVPIHLSGGAAAITIRRPKGVPARVHLKGWASAMAFDEQMFSNLGKDVRMQSPGYEGTEPGYDIEVASSASTVTIVSD